MYNLTGDSDYTSGLYNITIFAGQIAVSFDIPITSDNLLEGNETFRLFIIPKSLPYLFSRGNPATAVVMIINNEGKLSKCFYLDSQLVTHALKIKVIYPHDCMDICLF